MVHQEAMQRAFCAGVGELKRQTLPLLAQPLLRARATVHRFPGDSEHSWPVSETLFAPPSFDRIIREFQSASKQHLQPCFPTFEVPQIGHEFASVQFLKGALLSPHLSTFSSILSSPCPEQSRSPLDAVEKFGGETGVFECDEADSLSTEAPLSLLDVDEDPRGIVCESVVMADASVAQQPRKRRNRQAVLRQQVVCLQQQLREQRLASVVAALQHQQALALRAWASQALLERQRTTQQAEQVKAQDIMENTKRQELRLATLRLGRRWRTQRALFHRWMSACRSSATRSVGTNTPECKSARVTETARARGSHARGAYAVERRVYSLDQMLMQRQLLSRLRVSPPPGLDTPSGDSAQQPLVSLLAPPPGLSLPRCRPRGA